MATITGTSKNDELRGTNAADVIKGLAGNDTLFGLGGSDDLYGGAGIDMLNGGDGNDYLYGEDGDDQLYGDGGHDHIYGGSGRDDLYGGTFQYAANSGDDYLDGGTGADRMYGSDGDDTYVIDDVNDFVAEKAGYGTDTIISKLQEFTLAENVENGKFYDSSIAHGIIHGNSSDNSLEGNNNSSTLYGEGGNDTLEGGAITDFLYGGSGNDLLIGGAGGDELYGGTGNDIYKMDIGDGIDTISDDAGNDTIQLGSHVSKDNLAFFVDSNDTLFIDYGENYADQDRIEILNHNTNVIETIEVGDLSISNDTINQIIQDMSAYATDNGITISSVEDVKNNADLMNLISNALDAVA